VGVAVAELGREEGVFPKCGVAEAVRVSWEVDDSEGDEESVPREGEAERDVGGVLEWEGKEEAEVEGECQEAVPVALTPVEVGVETLL